MQLYLLANLMIEKEKYNNNIFESEESLDLFKNYYINLGLNGYSYSNILRKILHIKSNDIPKNWTIWDSIILNGPLKVSEFINEIERNLINIILK
jgi:hypothetical protein